MEGSEGVGDWDSMIAYVAPDGTSGLLFGSYADEYRAVDGTWLIDRMEVTLGHDTGGYHPVD